MPQENPKERRRKGAGCIIFSWGLCVVLTLLYLFRWDLVYAATVYPAWVYAIGGLGIAALGRPKPFWKGWRWPLLFWTCFVLAFSEEPYSLLRMGSWPSADWTSKRHVSALRIVTLNCAGGLPEAAAEVSHLEPDIVLLQESPGKAELEKLAKQLFGDKGRVVRGPDASILAREPLTSLDLPKATGDFVAARTSLPDGAPCLVVSLRLTPPVLRFDYWNPACWSEYADNLRTRRDELSSIVRFVSAHRGNAALVMGGDFNAGPTPGLARVMPQDLTDAFKAAGAGWGHTAVNDYPLVRIDQIWVSPQMDIQRSYARKTVNSDHRMFVADAEMSTGKK